MSSKTIEEAFEEWDTSRVPLKYQSSLDRRAAFIAGVAHGEAQQQQTTLAIIEQMKAAAKFGYQLDPLLEIEAAIRQERER